MPKCSECGYLALRRKFERDLIEAEDYVRSEGAILSQSSLRSDGYTVCDPWPICFVRAVDLRKEIGQPSAGMDPSNAKRLEVLTNDRPCDKATEWQQGFSPKEHAEMIQQVALLELQRKRDEEAREWKSSERRRNYLEILSVVVLAPFVAWFIPWLAQRNAPPPQIPPIQVQLTQPPADSAK